MALNECWVAVGMVYPFASLASQQARGLNRRPGLRQHISFVLISAVGALSRDGGKRNYQSGVGEDVMRERPPS